MEEAQQIKDPYELLKTGEKFLGAGDVKNALSHLKDAFSILPNNYWVLLLLSRAYGIQGNLFEQMKFLEKAIETNEMLALGRFSNIC